MPITICKGVTEYRVRLTPVVPHSTLPVMGRFLARGGGDGVFSSLSHSQYRALWTAQALSAIANWTVLTGRSWVAFDLRGQSGTVGLVVFASMVPYLFVTPIGGVLADRFDRRMMMIATMVISLATAVALAWMAFAGMTDAWLLVLLSFVNGAARAVEIPTGQSMVPAMVPERDLLNAVALGSLATHGSRLVGPLLAAPLLDMGGAVGAFALASGLYLIAVVSALRVKPVVQDRTRTIGTGAQFAEGVRYATTDRVVLMLIALVFFHCGLVMAYDAVLPVMAQDVLGSGGTAYSYLVMMIGAGSLVGTFALAGMSPTLHRGRLLLAVGVFSGATLLLLAFARGWPMALVAAALVGGSQAMFMALTNTFLQLITPDRVRGRVLALFLMAGGGVMAFANLATGNLADAYGVLPVLAIPAALFIAVVVISTFGASLRGVYGRRTAPSAAH